MADTGNPYQDQTDINTNRDWLKGGLPVGDDVEVDLSGMGEYAKNMMSVFTYMSERMTHLKDLGQLPIKAWTGYPLPEALLVSDFVLQNFAEHAKFLVESSVGAQTSAHAAQAAADYYRSRDGWSAVEMDGVDFAFGNKNIPAPSYWPYPEDQTFFEAAQQNGVDPEAAPDIWKPTREEKSADGTTVTYYSENQRGETRKMTIKKEWVRLPNDPAWDDGPGARLKETIVIEGPDGTSTTTIDEPTLDGRQITTPLGDGKKQIETSHGVTGNGTTTTTTVTTVVDKDGGVEVTGSKTVIASSSMGDAQQHYGHKVTTNYYNSAGHLDEIVVDELKQGDQTQTITTTTYDADGKVKLTHTVAFGEHTGEVYAEDPASGALTYIKETY